MGGAPFISICIPAYERREFLGRLLDSIQIQTFRSFEVIITDDSPGGEVQQLVAGHGLSPKIRYFRNRAVLGSPENWNEGIRMAEADWIKIMHDDDWFSGPESLQSFAEAIGKGRAEFYFSAYTNTFPDGRNETIQISARALRSIRRIPEILFAANRIGPPSAVIFKRDIAIEFDNRMQWLVDIDFYIRYLKKHPPPEYIPESLVRIGISKSQVTRSSFGNPGIEIPERFMLGEKLDSSSLDHILIFDSWWRFLRNLSIRELAQIRSAGYNGEIPDFIPGMIQQQRRIPRHLLRWGLSSKICMTVSYLLGKIHQ